MLNAGQSMKIYIARHGQDEDNASGILNGHRNMPLTGQGRRQAEEIAHKIRSAQLQFDAILSSPLLRAWDTAGTIARAIDGPTPRREPLLIERDFGVMSGERTSDIAVLCAPDIMYTDTITYFLNPEGGESFPVVLKRAEKMLALLRGDFSSDDSILLVCHGDIGKMLYAAYYGLEWRDVLQQFHFGNSELILLSDTSSAEEAHVFTIDQHNL